MSDAAPRWRAWWEAVAGLIYPTTCQLCGEPGASRESGYVCRRCAQDVRFVRPPFCARCGLPFPGEVTNPFDCVNCRDVPLAFESARAAVVARGPVLEAIHRFKYRRAQWFEPFLTGLLLREALPALRDGAWDGIVPVPLHPVKQREREFNQAERLAQPLANALGIPVRMDLVGRIRPTRTQTRLSREERAENVRHAFAPRSTARLRGGSFIVFDDVLTTGATTHAVAATLREMGAGRVTAWSVARATLE
jgi:competence protein ComFC